MGSAVVAHADPSYVLTGPETQARAGDLVHFTISGTHKHLGYKLEIGDTKVVEGSAGGNLVSGQFTLPNLGQAARTVTLEAELDGPGKKKTTTVRRELQYLGPALASGGPADDQPVVLPVVLPVVTQPAASGPVVPAPPAAAPAATRRSHGTPPRRARKRHTVKRRLHTPSSRRSTHRKHHSRDNKSGTRAKGPAPRTAPLFDGVPEPGSRRSHPPGNDAPGLKAIAPPTAALTATAGRGASGESNLAILVPGLVGLAAFALAGATLVRRHRTR
jgi:hypothetical protein